MIKKNVLLTVLILLMQIRIFAVPDELTQTKKAVESYVYEVSMSTANTREDIEQYLREQTEHLLVGDTVLYDIAITEFTSAVLSDEGEFEFVAELRCGDHRLTTSQISGVINTSRVVVTAVSGTAEVTQGESLLLSAQAFEIPKAKYEWYRSSGKNTVGELIEGADQKTYSPPTDTSYSAYFYCVCNGVRSNYVRVEIAPGFKAVSSIKLTLDKIYQGESVRLECDIEPTDASNKQIEWTVYENTGKAEIKDGVFYANQIGTVTVVAVIKNGIAENTDFAESFTVTVLPKPQIQPNVQQISIDVSSISALEKAYASVQNDLSNKTVKFSPMTKSEMRKVINSSGFESDGYYTLTAFSHSGESVEEYRATLSSYRGEMIVISQKDDVFIHKTLNAEDGDFVIDDFDKAVILVKKEFEPAWLLASVLAVPIVGALILTASKRKKKNINNKTDKKLHLSFFVI